MVIFKYQCLMFKSGLWQNADCQHFRQLFIFLMNNAGLNKNQTFVMESMSSISVVTLTFYAIVSLKKWLLM